MNGIKIIWLLSILIPVFGGVVLWAVSKRIVPVLSVVFILIAFILSLTLNFGLQLPLQFSFTWISGLDLTWNIDRVSAALISLVLFISLLVHLFSVYYMEDDPGKKRYYSELGFFTFSMVGLLSADHLLLVFIFWELVGFSSYLLIGFWYKNEEKSYSARYSFIVNRIADAGLLAGILTWWIYSGNSDLSTLTETTGNESWLVLASIGLLIGALGKSAQFPFYTWLPRAMAGPTPVSALIHAATMVAAGVYLLFRVYIIFPDSVRLATAIIGMFTAFLAGYSAFTQNDIKKVLAYSTISQLGYMVMAVGVGAIDMALFHLWTHAFFKAGLFLSAGAVIHFLQKQSSDDPQDMRLMGGLRKYLPITFYSYLACMLALSGLPLFTGFLSKDGIISAAWDFALTNEELFGKWIYILPDLAFITVFVTAFYMGRQLFLIFFGVFRNGELVNKNEPVITLSIPLILLAIGSLGLFYSINPFGHHFPFLDYLMEGGRNEAPSITGYTGLISFILAVGGISLSYYGYRRNQLIFREQGVLMKLSKYAFYLDSIYQVILINTFNKIAKDSAEIDQKIIDPVINWLGMATVVFAKLIDLFDKLIVDGLVNLSSWVSEKVGALTSMFTASRVQLHVFWVVLSMVLILLWLNF